MRILAGDIGGTHARLAIAQVEDRHVTLLDAQRFLTAGRGGVDELLAEFLAAHGPVAAICLAVAGPTDGLTAQFTNLSWRIDAAALSARFAMPARLVNDFAAVGWGLNALRESDLAVLQTGSPRHTAPRLAVGAGTGLGVSLCVASAGVHRPLDSEGGHIGFAPVDAEQDRLLAFLREEHQGRVSVERLVSGPGLASLYRFCLADAGRAGGLLAACRTLGSDSENRPRRDQFSTISPGNSRTIAQEMGEKWAGAVGLQPEIPKSDRLLEPRAISEAGLAGQDAEAAHALRLFAQIYGQVAGDLALVARAQGGVYLAGGIAPQILPVLQSGAFLAGFHAKGRFSDWMQQVPVTVILDPDIGLKGAALAAVV